MTTTEAQTAMDRMVFRKTNSHPGRHISVTPANSANRHLSYGRIVLNHAVRSVRFVTGERETGLIVLSGSAGVIVDGQPFELGRYDGIYIPRGSSVEVNASQGVDGVDGADLAEFSADVEGRFPLQVVRYVDVRKDPTLQFAIDKSGQERQVSIVLGKNVEAGRLVAGFTVSEPGNWTSWPPHEHADLLEEMYVYFDMPEPAFGIQLVNRETEYPELVTVVRDGDAVLMPSGYLPTSRSLAIASPSCGPWPRTAKSKTGCSGWSTYSPDLAAAAPDWKPVENRCRE